ncbi:MAG: CAP domain-containing protein, partial [Pseudomonadota bacterium]
MQTTSLLKLVALVSALALSACGGGSASLSTAPAGPGPGSGSTATPADLQLSVPAPTYGATSQELRVFQAVNDFRASLHLGLWAQNASLDTSAKNHTSYSLLAGYLGHTEDPAARGFTGVAPLDRDRLAGYAGSIATELGAALVANTGVADADAGVALVTSLKNSVYHNAVLMDQGFREMGASVLSDGSFIDLFIEIGFQSKPQSNASDFTLFYPLNGQTG